MVERAVGAGRRRAGLLWTIAQPGQEPVPTAVDEWTESTDAAYREGRRTVRSHFYYVSLTVFPEVYVNTFGIGSPGCRCTGAKVKARPLCARPVNLYGGLLCRWAAGRGMSS